MPAIEVAYATPHKQKIITLDVPEGTSALRATELSGIVKEFPEIDLAQSPMGIFSQVLGSRGLPPPDQYRVQSGDRIEIYRKLIVDPKEMRRKRAAETKAKKQNET